MVAKGEVGGSGLDWEFGVSRCKLLHVEWICNEVLFYSTGNYIQSLGIENDGPYYEKKNIYIYNIYTYTYIYDWVTKKYSRNWHNPVNQLFLIKFKKFKMIIN